MDIIKRLDTPHKRVDAVIDTDAFNEVDDQFAISYLLRSADRINTVALYAAPFSFPHINTERGMEESFREINLLLDIMNIKKDVFRGSTGYLPDESTPVISEAARDLASRAMAYTAESPLYVIAIGAITNVASALLLNPEIAERTVIVWLGGHAHHFGKTDEYNMRQDIAAARVVMSSAAPLVQLPCNGTVSAFYISCDELRCRLLGKNELCDHLAQYVIEAMREQEGKDWTRVLWDVTAVGWLLNEGERFMLSRIEKTRLPDYAGNYEGEPIEKPMRYVYHINRDPLMNDMIDKLTK
ncbi:MAG: nucleoside hydrolase [Clostridia bacterium]|nr:nucleoside hydrolase [Clostridia bacterium]MBR3681386.1 nucleoside hydrolase [Clostridia bacterium]